MKIEIKTSFSNDYTTREAGEKLREMIIAGKEIVELDFKGLKIASASFFDEGIAKLADHGWTEDDFKTKLAFKNIFSKDLSLLKSTLRARGIELGG